MSKIYVDEIAGIASPSTVAIPGHVIQVVEGISATTSATTTSSSYVDTPLSVNITPSSTSSKIVVFVSTEVTNITTGGAQTWLTIYRDSTNLGGGSNSGLFSYANSLPSGYEWVGASLQVIDSPASTSQLTYKLRMAVSAGTGYCTWNSVQSSIIAMEIAG